MINFSKDKTKLVKDIAEIIEKFDLMQRDIVKYLKEFDRKEYLRLTAIYEIKGISDFDFWREYDNVATKQLNDWVSSINKDFRVSRDGGNASSQKYSISYKGKNLFRLDVENKKYCKIYDGIDCSFEDIKTQIRDHEYNIKRLEGYIANPERMYMPKKPMPFLKEKLYILQNYIDFKLNENSYMTTFKSAIEKKKKIIIELEEEINNHEQYINSEEYAEWEKAMEPIIKLLEELNYSKYTTMV